MDFLNPKTLVQRMKIHSGMVVGDIGSGIGHYSLAIANLVGKEGRVYAIDIQEDVLTHLRHNAEEQHIQNIETIWGDIEKQFGTKIRDNILDAVVFSNILFQLENKSSALAELKRIIKIGGKLLLVEWSSSRSKIGPAVDRIITEDDASKLLNEAGFQENERFTVGTHHYAIIASAI